MKYRVLGNTGVKVSELCLGTMTFGEKLFNIAEVDLKPVDLQLTPEEIEQLSQTTAPPSIHPQWMIERQNAGRVEPVETEPKSAAVRR